jgi:hypothetical protein
LRRCNAYANGDSYPDGDANGDGHVYPDSNSDSYGYVHADAYSDANRSETVANAAGASNNTAAASVVRIGKWNC